MFMPARIINPHGQKTGRIIFYIVSISLLFGLQVYAKEKTTQKIFSIDLKMPDAVNKVEIEFLDKSDDEEAIDSKSRIVKIKDKHYETNLFSWEKYFRVRSIHQTGVRGAWSKIRSLDDYLKKAYREPKLSFIQSGATEYLIGSRIELIAQNEMIVKYKLNNEKNHVYEEPITLGKEANYTLEITMENPEKAVIYKKVYHFRVDLTPPKTQRIITSPVYIQNHASMGLNSRLEIRGYDSASGVKNSFYRCIPLNLDFEMKPFVAYKSPLSRTDLIGEQRDLEICLLQYYSIDHSGNSDKISSELLYLE